MSSTCSAAAAAAGPSACTGPDSAPSPRAKLILGAAPPTPGISPASACSPTSESSAPGTSPISGQLTLWPEARPVRNSRPRTRRGAGSTASAAACSSNSCGWCANCDPVGHSLRTCLASALAATTGYTMRWKRRATPCGRSWWALGTPELPIDATEPGSSRDGTVPTLPTPRSTDGDRGGRGDLIQALRGNENKHFRLPTPRPCSGLRSRGVNQTELMRALLPTPIKRDWKSGAVSAATMARNARPLNEVLRRELAPHSSSGTADLLAVVEWIMGYPVGWLGPPWPPSATPSSRKSRRPSAARSSRSRG